VSGLVGEVRRFGLLSAAAVVDRYTRLVDQALEQPSIAGGSSAMWADPSWLVERASSLAGAYLRFLDGAGSLLVPQSDAGQQTMVEMVTLSPVRVGGTSEGSLFVHNPTAEWGRGISVEVAPLVSASGGLIGPDSMQIDPSVIDLGPSSSVEVRLRVTPPENVAPGRFFGTARISIAPEDLVLIELPLVAGDDG
jgi:hypothetical protein